MNFTLRILCFFFLGTSEITNFVFDYEFHTANFVVAGKSRRSEVIAGKSHRPEVVAENFAGRRRLPTGSGCAIVQWRWEGVVAFNED